MTEDAPSSELLILLGRAEAALAAGDCDGADAEMKVAADLCGRLQNAGVTIAGEQLRAVREVAERCGLALAHLRQKLNAESQRDENHRRAFLTYQASQRG